MYIYVNASAAREGNGTKETPFKHINDAAKVAKPGDEVLVAPGVYREYVDPIHAGTGRPASSTAARRLWALSLRVQRS